MRCSLPVALRVALPVVPPAILPVVLALCAAIAMAPAAAQTTEAGPGDRVTAGAAGLHLTGPDGSRRDVPFGSPFHSTMHAMVAVFGHEIEIAFPQECGAGPLVSASIPGRIDLTFQDDRLAGWFLGRDDALAVDDSVGPGGGLALGAPRAALPEAETLWYADSTLGEEFTLGAVAGLMSEDGASVAYLWTGVNCILR